MKGIKSWIDGECWTKQFKDYDKLSEDEKFKIRKGLEESAAVYLLRNWMETKLVFLEYLIGGKDSSFFQWMLYFQGMSIRGVLGIYHIYT